MNDYSKWDQIVDSDEEKENRQRKHRSYEDDAAEKRRELQAQIDSWLKRQIHKLPRDGDPTTKRLRESMGELSSNRAEPTPVRAVTKAEREVLSMLIAMSHFEEGDTNLDRHAMMLDLARHNRWLEEDPGTIELLCRVHNHVMKESGENGRHAREFEDPEQHRMRNMVLSGINTLAAPKKAKCPGGLLELFTLICTPETEAGREMRKKWQTKEFAKDALFDSLFPDLRQYSDENVDDSFGSDFWIILVLGLLAIVGIIAFIVLYYNGTMGPSARGSKASSNLSNLSIAGNSTAGAGVTTLLPPLTASAPPLAPAPALATAKLACADSNEGCASWAQMGECKNNAEYMLATCRLSCSVCTVAAPAPPTMAPLTASTSGVADARAEEL